MNHVSLQKTPVIIKNSSSNAKSGLWWYNTSWNSQEPSCLGHNKKPWEWEGVKGDQEQAFDVLGPYKNMGCDLLSCGLL